MADTVQIKGAGHYENQWNSQTGEMESTFVQEETPVHTDYSSTYDGATTASMLSKAGIDIKNTGFTPDKIGSVPGLVNHLVNSADPAGELPVIMNDTSLFVLQQMQQAVYDYGMGTHADAGDEYNNDKKTQMQDLAKWLGTTGKLTPEQITQAASQAYQGGYSSYNLGGSGWGEAFKMFAPILLAPFTAGLSQYLGTALGSATAGSAIAGALTSAVTGGDWKTGLITGGLGANASTNLGGGFTIGDALKGIKAIQAINSGNLLGAFSSIASMSGVGSTKVGDTGLTINELAKDANLLNAVIKGNPVALMNTISSISKSASSNSPSNTAYTKEDYDNLSPELQAIYDTQGPAGIKAYIEQQKADIAAQKANQDEIDRLNALHPPPVEQPPVEQPPPPEQPPTGNLPTVAVTAPPPPAPPVDLTSTVTPPLTAPTSVTPPPLATVAVTAPKCDPGFHYDEALKQCVPDESALPPAASTSTVTPPPPVTPPLVGTVNVTAPKCDPGFHYDETAKACVQDESALPPVTSPVTSTVTPPVNPRDPVVPTDPVVITANKYCNIGEHWDEASGKCVPDVVDLTPVVAPPLKVPAITPTAAPPVKPPATPTATAKSTTTTRSPTTASGFFDPVLDTSPQFLAGKYVPTKELSKLASLHQLFNSLHPDMQALMAERNITPPPMPAEDLTQNQSAELTPEEQIKANQTVFSASGGLISSETQKIIDSLSPKFASPASTFLAGAPVTQHQSPLGTLKHLAQGPLKGPKLGSGLSHGGLPHKYAEAAPKGHNPEFITGLTGYYAQGGGTGQSDDIPAMLHDGDFVMDADTVASLGDGSSKAGAEVLEQMRNKVPYRDHQGGHPVPAQIADGEYVFPAAFVTAIGGGSNKVGAERLNEMREKIRAHKRSAPTTKIPPKAKSPLDYLKMAKG